MALEMNDLLALKSMGRGSEMTPYEQVKLDYMSSRNQTSKVGIAGLTVGVGAAVLAIAAGAWAGSRASNAKEVAITKNDGLKDLVSTLAGTLAAERNERIAGDITLTNTVNDTVSGSQQGTLTAMQQAELNATQQLMIGLQTGKYSENPQQVVLMSGRRECACPASGCGCNG